MTTSPPVTATYLDQQGFVREPPGTTGIWQIPDGNGGISSEAIIQKHPRREQFTFITKPYASNGTSTVLNSQAHLVDLMQQNNLPMPTPA